MRWLFGRRKGERPAPKVKWLDGYTGQSTDELIRLEGDYRLDSLVLAFEGALQRKADQDGLDSLSKPERVVLAVEAVEREVNNGGYDQLFRNSSKELTPYFEESLAAIGRPEVSSITGRAIKALGLHGDVSVDAIDLAMDRDDERRDANLEDCDTAYFDSAGDLAGPLFAFIKTNRDSITLTS